MKGAFRVLIGVYGFGFWIIFGIFVMWQPAKAAESIAPVRIESGLSIPRSVPTLHTIHPIVLPPTEANPFMNMEIVDEWQTMHDGLADGDPQKARLKTLIDMHNLYWEMRDDN